MTILSKKMPPLRSGLAKKILTYQTTAMLGFWIKIFALCKGVVGLIFTFIFLPLNASLAVAKGSAATAKAKVRHIRRHAPTKQGSQQESYANVQSANALASPTPDSALVAEYRLALIDYARTLIGKPYRSAGKSPSSGFDCSGFTGYVFRQFGINLSSCSAAQSTMGQAVDPAQARPGDLVFFGRRSKRGRTQVSHAGIVASTEAGLRVIHSASRIGVTVSDLSKPGYWRTHMLSIRRVIVAPPSLLAAQ